MFSLKALQILFVGIFWLLTVTFAKENDLGPAADMSKPETFLRSVDVASDGAGTILSRINQLEKILTEMNSKNSDQNLKINELEKTVQTLLKDNERLQEEFTSKQSNRNDIGSTPVHASSTPNDNRGLLHILNHISARSHYPLHFPPRDFVAVQ